MQFAQRDSVDSYARFKRFSSLKHSISIALFLITDMGKYSPVQNKSVLFFSPFSDGVLSPISNDLSASFPRAQRLVPWGHGLEVLRARKNFACGPTKLLQSPGTDASVPTTINP